VVGADVTATFVLKSKTKINEIKDFVVQYS